ncbi:glycosyltransferase family 4 protein [Salipiger bermudensis]|uniref:glycosyltransferase family 4 protein n=1 Tax=Salipiger bermudensis TaxID=344736 RepID=UPI001CD59CFF|nr:glycosyltransferase family 4 protein [Salipiger bermudensis]MCA1284261.1 glycosyltransferase family 4 protein [Salipiger bermudensis]
MRACAFAIPGDHRQKTGGFIYQRRLLEELQASGRHVEHVRLPAEAAAAEQDVALRAEVAEVLEALPPDQPLILDGLLFAAMETAQLARLRCPVVAMLHHPMGMEQGLAPDLSRQLLAQEMANIRHAEAVVVTSPHTRQTYIGLGADPDRITVALPGYDGPRDLTGVEAGPRILSVGLLARRKGHDVLIRALARIADLDWSAQIVGKSFDPVVEAELRALIAETGLGGRVALAGELPDAALARAYREARLFALATRYEGYGMALAEALCHGLPIVTCAGGAVPDTVGQGALLAPPDDPESFADHLRRLLSDDAARAELARRARAEGRALPRWSDTAAIMGRVLDGIQA